ncbi:MAG: type II toxin-antitoxin system HicB family antitoxin [Nitrososphaerales archaeon]|nr:type II toxin-antitoxin system HicB family antitoxin [Nitrososphaerales archaeon]
MVAKCKELKGAISQGKTKEEALKNIVEAISAILEDIYEGREAPEFSVTWEER